MIEMRDLFTKDEIFKERRAAGACLERVLIVVYRRTLISGQSLTDTVLRITLQIVDFVSFVGRLRKFELRYLLHDAFLHDLSLSLFPLEFVSVPS